MLIIFTKTALCIEKIFHIFSTFDLRVANVNKKFIKYMIKSLDFWLQMGYIIYASVSTHLFRVLKSKEKR